MPKAAASTRAYEHANFSFGLVNVPVDIFSGTVSDAGISRKWFTADDHEVGYVTIDKETGDQILRSEIVTKIGTEYGHVYVEDHEIEKLFSLNPKSIEVVAFQPQHLFYQGHYVPKSLYYVEASKTVSGKKKIPNKAAQTTLALVLQAMKDEGAVAVVNFTTRGKSKPAVLLPNGTLWLVHHSDELREQRPLPEIELNEAVVQQGRQLLKMLWKDEPLDLSDTQSALIQGFADEKAKAGNFGKPEAPEEVETTAAEPSMDLMALLQASIDTAKKAAS